MDAQYMLHSVYPIDSIIIILVSTVMTITTTKVIIYCVPTVCQLLYMGHIISFWPHSYQLNDISIFNLELLG